MGEHEKQCLAIIRAPSETMGDLQGIKWRRVPGGAVFFFQQKHWDGGQYVVDVPIFVPISEIIKDQGTNVYD